ncbi:unnamed protein product, partial [Rotaria sordida]
MQSQFTDDLLSVVNVSMGPTLIIHCQHLFRTVELLWNLLEYGPDEQICDQLNSRVTI